MTTEQLLMAILAVSGLQLLVSLAHLYVGPRRKAKGIVLSALTVKKP